MDLFLVNKHKKVAEMWDVTQGPFSFCYHRAADGKIVHRTNCFLKTITAFISQKIYVLTASDAKVCHRSVSTLKKHVTSKEELSWWINSSHCDVFCGRRLHTSASSSVKSAAYHMNGCNMQDGSSGVPGGPAALGPGAPEAAPCLIKG